MFRKLLLSLALLAPSAAFAQDYCHQWDNNPQVCSNDRNCLYDYDYRSCDGRNSGGNPGYPDSCSRWDHDAFTCNNDLNCAFDNRSDRCLERRGPSGPGRDQCSWYNNDPYTCNQVLGCSYDNWQHLCSEYGGGGNNGGLQTTTLACGSYNYGYSHCQAPGRVYDAYLINQESQGNCQQGSSWGFDQTGIWTNNGCRAHFQVRYYRNQPCCQPNCCACCCCCICCCCCNSCCC